MTTAALIKFLTRDPTEKAALLAEVKRLRKSKCSTYHIFGTEKTYFAAQKTYNYYSPSIQAWAKHAPRIQHVDRADFARMGRPDPLHGQIVSDPKYIPTPEQVEAEYQIHISLGAKFGVSSKYNFNIHRSELATVIRALE